MKKPLIISALLAGTLSAFPQGTIIFQDAQSDVTIHIFAPQAGYRGESPEVTGDQGSANGTATGGVSSDLYDNNGADNNQAGGAIQGAGATGTITTGGTTVYTGGAIGNTLTSNPTPAGLFNYNNGSDYTVQLYAAPGLNVAASNLQPVPQYVTTIFTSSTKGGEFKTINPVNDPGIPNTFGGSATIMLIAWYNAGTGLTYAQALAAGYPIGFSPTDNIANLGNIGIPPNPPNDMEGLESFSLITSDEFLIPEPSPIGLAALGASAFLFRRRQG